MRLPLTLLVALLLPAPALAQVRHAEQAHAWVGLLGDYPIGDRFALYQEVWLRRADWGRTWQTRHFAQGVTLTIDPRWRVTAGYTYAHGSPYGALPAAAATDENRAWAHVTFAHETGRLRWSHRTRAEWRFIHADAEWHRTARWRQQLRLTYPLGAKAYVFGAGETFTRLYPTAERYALEQTRAQAGFGRTIAKDTRLELGYLNQRLRRATEREENHTLVANLRATWRIR
jgi:hypothetical protein